MGRRHGNQASTLHAKLGSGVDCFNMASSSLGIAIHKKRVLIDVEMSSPSIKLQKNTPAMQYMNYMVYVESNGLL